MFTILAVKVSALAAAMGTPMLAEQQSAVPGHTIAPATLAQTSHSSSRAPFDHAFAFHDSSAIAQVTAQSLDAAERAEPVNAEREVFIPSPGTIALLGIGTFAMRRKRST